MSLLLLGGDTLFCFCSLFDLSGEVKTSNHPRTPIKKINKLMFKHTNYEYNLLDLRVTLGSSLASSLGDSSSEGDFFSFGSFGF